MFQPIRKYADFNGRARRSEYWLFQLFFWGTLFGLGFLSTILTVILVGPETAEMTEAAVAARNDPAATTGAVISGVLGLVMVAFFLGMLVPNLAVRIRRLHDIGVTGWLILIAIIPGLGGLALLIMSLLDGTYGSNSYGPDPKGRGEPRIADTFS